MSATLLESLSSLVTPDLVRQAASTFGDSEAAVSKGLTAAFPAVLGSLANRAGDTNFASTLFNLVRDPANDGSVLGNIGSLLGSGAASLPMMALGGKLLGSLFGNNLGSLGGALASFAGLKPASGASLLSFAAPLVLSLLGKSVKSGNLNASSLAGLLIGQKSTYTAALPGPLSRLENYFAAPTASYAVPPAPEAKKSSIWRWLLPLLIVLGLLWMLSRCMGGKEEATTQMAPAPAVEPAPLPAPVVEPAPAALPSANYYFEVDKFELPVAREGSLEAVVEYLKANPTSVAVLSGYHDPTGDKAHNEELAKNRAQAVKDRMLADGVPESQVEMVKPIETTGSGDLEEARRVEVTIRP